MSAPVVHRHDALCAEAVIIKGEQLEQHDVRAAPWQQHVPAPADTPAGLLRQLHELGTVARLDLLTAALEAARRDAAGQALDAVARWIDGDHGAGGPSAVAPSTLRMYAERARAGQL
jgi:hypothetical protein